MITLKKKKNFHLVGNNEIIALNVIKSLKFDTVRYRLVIRMIG